MACPASASRASRRARRSDVSCYAYTYEVRRELAPYIRVHWMRRFGETADLAGDDGETRFVAGVRLWF
jgi:uncharacterized protein involved in copper resistance